MVPAVDETTSVQCLSCIQARQVCELTANLCQEDAKESHGQSSKLVLLDQLIQVEAEQLKHQAQMVLEDEEGMHPDKMMLVIWIADFVQVLQDPNFDTGLVVKCCLVLDDLYGYHLPCLLTYAFGNLPKGALSQHVADDVPEFGIQA